MPDAPGGSAPTLHIGDAVARIALNRPHRHNRFEVADVGVLGGMLDEVARSRGVRALVLSAAGPSFSAGFDLTAMGADDTLAQATAFGRLCDRVEALPMPTVCALNGGVHGGATDLALACDVRVGVNGMRMTMPAVRLGLEYFHGGLRRYVEQLGPASAKRLLLTADAVDAQTLLRIGFLHEVVAAEALADAVEAVVASCVSAAPGAARGLKASLNAIAQGRADPAEIDARFAAALASPDAREGLRAWRERRPPRFADA